MSGTNNVQPDPFGAHVRRKEIVHAVGLMSGTSCDGMDAALVRIRATGEGPRCELLAFECIPYAQELRDRLLESAKDEKSICLLNFEIGKRMADAVEVLRTHAGAHDVEIDFIASHGHTMAHFPLIAEAESATAESVEFGTFQIGEPSFAAERIGKPVVSDFRPRDMVAGGQGAPLVPYADWLLFRETDRAVACLNIGGIANVTLVPPVFDEILAFDTGPGNMIIDGAAAILSDQSLQMDVDGGAAARGRIIEPLFDRLMANEYFDLSPPKSAGREQFGPDVYLQDLARLRKVHDLDDGLATVTAVVSESIVNAIQRYVVPVRAPDRLIVSGGGAFNKTLMKRIARALSECDHLTACEVLTGDEAGIPSDAKEAMAFALLGYETLMARPSNVPSATGAKHHVVLGKITPGR